LRILNNSQALPIRGAFAQIVSRKPPRRCCPISRQGATQQLPSAANAIVAAAAVSAPVTSSTQRDVVAITRRHLPASTHTVVPSVGVVRCVRVRAAANEDGKKMIAYQRSDRGIDGVLPAAVRDDVRSRSRSSTSCSRLTKPSNRGRAAFENCGEPYITATRSF
jgi:hypothetical protein